MKKNHQTNEPPKMTGIPVRKDDGDYRQMDERLSVRSDSKAADLYRLEQARNLMREAGLKETEDGEFRFED